MYDPLFRKNKVNFLFPKRPFIICFVGIDGSGKTTLSKRLVNHLREQVSRARYVHSFHSPILLKPLKLLAKLTLMRNTDQYSDYSQYKNIKNEKRKSHGILSKIYGSIWILDYYIQDFLFIIIPSIFSKILVLDRYIFDVVINFSLTMDVSEQIACRLINFLFNINLKPGVTFLVDIPEEMAFSRKSDIPHIKYLRDRRKMYLNLASIFNMHILDGTKSIEDLMKDIIITLNNG